MSGFLDALQNAVFNGVPFKVRSIETSSSRKLAVHRYPFKDGGWPEDLGRDLATYQIEGHLIGDDAPALAALLKGMADVFGSGILVHPALGAILVNLVGISFAVHYESLRVINLRAQFIEAAQPSLASIIISTVIETLTFADQVQASTGSDYQATIAPALVSGPEPAMEAGAVTGAAAAIAVTASQDPTGSINAVATLPGNYGRYAAGNASEPAPVGSTVQSLIQGVTLQQLALTNAVATVAATTPTLSATTDLMTPLVAMMQAMAACFNNPADKVRLLLNLCTFSYTDAYSGTGLTGDIAILRDATAALVRRAAIVVIGQISTAYQPTSYNDAATVRTEIVDAIDAEILVAGDEGDDASYLALRSLRSAVSADLTARGANLADIVTVTVGASLPALVLAYSLYGDASRSDELIRRANPNDPCYMPLTFQALSR